MRASQSASNLRLSTYKFLMVGLASSGILVNFANPLEIGLLIERELLAMHHQLAEKYCEPSMKECDEKHKFYSGLAENLFHDLEEVHDEFRAAINIKFQWRILRMNLNLGLRG